MVSFSLPTFVTGLGIADGMSAKSALLAIFWGSLIVTIIGSVMGAVGAKSRLSSYLLVRIAFGDKGAGVVNIAFAISLLGWFGVNINLFTEAVAKLSVATMGASVSVFWLSVLASLCMTFTTIVGFRAINFLSTLLVPVLAVVTFLFAKTALEQQGLGELLAIEKVNTMSIGEGISAIVGAIIIGAIILPDITRFIRRWQGGVYTAVLAYMVVALIVMVAASLAGSVSGEANVLDIMLDLNLGIGAFVIVIAGSWVLNSLNLYSAVLSTKATFPKLPATMLTIALGVIGVAAALMNILDSFISFLFYLSVIFIPVAGVIMSDYLLICPGRYRVESLVDNRSLNIKGFVAWAIGAAFAVLASESIIPSPSEVAAIDAVILTGIVYLALAWNERADLVDDSPTGHGGEQ
ncbi:MAG: cytosine permease [Gammaproteobacteria bacterium]|nr:cytosine permease [Gammaproteobacteria bacterium]